MIYISANHDKIVYIELIDAVEKFEIPGRFGISFTLQHHHTAMWLYHDVHLRDQEFHEINNIWSNYKKASS